MLPIFSHITELHAMNVGKNIRRMREAKGFSQKQVAAAAKMDRGQYSRIENGKGDPSLSTLVKIAKALKMELYDLFKEDALPGEVNSLDKSIIEKVSMIEQLDKKEKTSFYAVLDAFVGKKKLKDAFSKVMEGVE